jgi:hypothetical protein
MLNYFLFVSVAGVCLLVFFALCCFFNVEALHLPTGKKNQRGIEVFVAAIVNLKNFKFIIRYMQDL